MSNYPGSWQPGNRVQCRFLGKGTIEKPSYFDDETSEPAFLTVKFDDPVSPHFDAFAARRGNVTTVLASDCEKI